MIRFEVLPEENRDGREEEGDGDDRAGAQQRGLLQDEGLGRGSTESRRKSKEAACCCAYGKVTIGGGKTGRQDLAEMKEPATHQDEKH